MEWGPRWPGVVVAALAVAAAGCGGSEAKEPAASEPALRVVNVEVEPVAAVSFTDVVNLIGEAVAERDVMVAAEEGGVVRALYVEKGARVRAGQPILKIDDALLAAQVAQAEADAALARETFERQRRLWEEDQIGTEMAYLQAKYASERAAANLRLLSERLERTTVRAPISGVLDARLVDFGAMVAPGSEVARIVDTDTIKVVSGVPERYATEIRPGAQARVVFDVLAGRSFDGVIGFVAQAVRPQDRTVPIEIAVPNPGGVIRPGMVAAVEIVRRELDEVVVVPQEAVLRTEAGYIVYVAADRGGETVAEARPVTTGASRANRVVIDSGLEPGDLVIVVGQHRIAAGDRLQIVARRRGGDR